MAELRINGCGHNTAAMDVTTQTHQDEELHQLNKDQTQGEVSDTLSHDEDEEWDMPFPHDPKDDRSLGPLVKTPPHTVQKIIRRFHLDRSSDESSFDDLEISRVIDLGSGDGDVLLQIAQECCPRPKTTPAVVVKTTPGRVQSCIGYELDQDLVQLSQKVAQEMDLSSVLQFHCQDLMELHPRDYATLDKHEDLYLNNTLVIIFLTPWAMVLLEDHVSQALRAGAKVISYYWPMSSKFMKGLGDASCSCTCEELDPCTYLYQLRLLPNKILPTKA